MIIRRFRIGDEIALFRVFYSAIHDIASHDYTRDQVDAWAPADLDQKMWAEHVRDLRPFVAEIDGEIVGYADILTFNRAGISTTFLCRVLIHGKE